jgi:hypothetical protein
MARWTSEQLRQHRGKAIEAKTRQCRPPKSRDKTALLFTRLCSALNVPEPIAEFRFHPTRRWRIDFYFEANGRKVGLEVEGGVWTNGRHTRGKGFIKDIEKYNTMSEMGIVLLRVTPDQLLNVSTIEMIRKCLHNEKNGLQ